MCVCGCVFYYYSTSAVALNPPVLALYSGPLFVFCGFLLTPDLGVKAPNTHPPLHTHLQTHTDIDMHICTHQVFSYRVMHWLNMYIVS